MEFRELKQLMVDIATENAKAEAEATGKPVLVNTNEIGTKEAHLLMYHADKNRDQVGLGISCTQCATCL